MGNPKLLLLDEPSEGIAPVIVEQMAETIVKLKKGGLAGTDFRAEPAFCSNGSGSGHHHRKRLWKIRWHF